MTEAAAAMVRRQLRARDITNPRVLAAMERVPREAFVPKEYAAEAYDDRPVPIGEGQTISQPYIVAYMTQALEPMPTDRVLEIGTGCGYQSAILAELVSRVHSIERVPSLAKEAAHRLSDLGYRNVEVRHGDGFLGWPEYAPFDKIILTAAPDDIPPTLVDQLAVGGILVAPVGRDDQTMTIVRRTAEGIERRETIAVRFVPMLPSG